MELDNVDDIYPLAPMQHLMLMHSLRVKGASTLVNQFRFRLRGDLDETRFSQAWQRVVQKHGALRTAVVWEEVPEPVQVVMTRVESSPSYVDLRDRPAAERDSIRTELLARDRGLGFDLRRAPLIRLTVIRVTDDESLLILTRHHLILDLWSAEIVFNELFEGYATLDRCMSEPAGQFRSYLEWLDAQPEEAAQAYWAAYLSGFEKPSLLFSSRAVRAEWTADGQSSATIALSVATSSAFTVTARNLGATSATLLQGLLALVVSLITRQDDVVYGLTVSGRPQQVAQVESIVGSFINNVPVRFLLNDDLPIVEWLLGIQRAQSERIAYEHVSPVDQHRWSGIAADAPLFDLLVLLQSPLVSALSTGPLTVEPEHGPMDSALPMTLAIESGSQGITLTAVHDPGVVTTETARQILEAGKGAIEAAAAGLPRCVGELKRRIAPSVTCSVCAEQAPNADAPQAPVPQIQTTAPPANAGDAMLAIFRATLGNHDIGPDDDFFAVGGTSIQAAMAFVEIERQFGRAMPLSTLFTAGSVRRLLGALELPDAPASSLVSIQRFGARPPIVAVSGIGGNVVGLAQVARALGRDQPLYGLQSRTFVGGDLPPDSIEGIASEYVRECERFMDAPLVLLGICFGVNVVVEMARQLNEDGRPPALVIALDPSVDDELGAPQQNRIRPSGIRGFLVDRGRLFLTQVCTLRGAERRAFLRDKWHAVVEKVLHWDPLYGNHMEIRQRQVRETHLRATQRYRPRPCAGNIQTILTNGRGIASNADPRLRWLRVMDRDPNPVYIPGIDTGDVLHNHAMALAARIRHWVDPLSQ